METKTCTKCNQLKSVDDFNWKNKTEGRRDSLCKVCRSAEWSKYYGVNKEAHRRAVSKYNKIQREEIKKLRDELKSVPCADCGKSYGPHVMDFDHREGETKRGNPADISAKYSLKFYLKEIAKCDVVCSNCHRERTYQRRLKKE